MIRLLGILIVGVGIVMVLTGVTGKMGESLGCERHYTSLDLAACFLSGGIVVILYKDRLGKKKEA